MHHYFSANEAGRLLTALDIFECRVQHDGCEFVLNNVEFLRDPRTDSWVLRQWSRVSCKPSLVAESEKVRAAWLSFEDLFLDLGHYVVVVTLCSRSSSVLSLIRKVLSEEDVSDEG